MTWTNTKKIANLSRAALIRGETFFDLISKLYNDTSVCGYVSPDDGHLHFYLIYPRSDFQRRHPARENNVLSVYR